MATRLTENRTNYWYSSVVNASICSIICFTLLSAHLYNYCKNELWKKTSKHHTKLAQLPLHRYISIVSLVTIISFTIPTIYAFIFVLIDASSSTQLFCHNVSIKIGTALYQMGKTLMYVLFVLQLYSVYENTAFAFNKYTLISCGAIAVIISLLISISAIYVATPLKYQYQLTANEIKYQCTGTYPDYQLAIFGINEIIVTLMVLYAFISPLKKMISMSQNKHTNEARKRISKAFKFVAIKISILTLTAMCSSFLTMIIIGISRSTGIAAIDMIINTICIMLMSGYYGKWYYKLCCCCIQCCKCCENSNIKKENKIEIDVQTTGRMSSKQELKTKTNTMLQNTPTTSNSTDTLAI